MQQHARRLAFVIGAFAAVVNPGLACDQGGDDYEFGQQELEATVVGTWRVAIGDESWTVALMPAPAPAKTASALPLVRPAAACGNRAFYRSAAACVDSTSLSLVGTATAAEPGAAPKPVTGGFTVEGKRFTNGQLGLTLPDKRTIYALVDRTGKTSMLSYAVPGRPGEPQMKVEVERLSR